MAESLIEQLPKVVAEGRKEENLFKSKYQNIDGQN